MHSKELKKLGVPPEATGEAATACAAAAASGMGRKQLRRTMKRVVGRPEMYTDDDIFGPLADRILDARQEARDLLARQGAPYTVFGKDIETGALKQMENAALLPVAVRGALLPDAHVGYGLPIGGVLAVDNAVIPYAVGMDIACRMKLSILDLDPSLLESDQTRERLAQALDRETRFGVGAAFTERTGRRQHAVMDEDWSFAPVVRRLKDKAWSQLGTSGSGNHFVEFGVLHLGEKVLGMGPGTYTALVSHSGSRGAGGEIAGYFSRLAMRQHPHLPKGFKHLAWLAMDSAEGREYWKAMELMGRYAAASHELIHRHVAGHLGLEILAGVENHHNFAFVEELEGRRVVIHRKGATPAALGVLGYIPGSMADPGFVVRGLGSTESLQSASHGAGRALSRKEATARFNRRHLDDILRERGVTLISGSTDESPMAYKDIRQVMEAQDMLVETLGRFDPRLVKMAR